MIKSFQHKGLEKLLLNGDASKVIPEHTKRLRACLVKKIKASYSNNKGSFMDCAVKAEAACLARRCKL